MALYLNPTGCTKEEWLLRHGVRIRKGNADLVLHTGYDPSREKTTLIVALVHNAQFTAAAVATSANELQRYLSDTTGRTIHWYLVAKKDLEDECGAETLRMWIEEAF